MSLVIAVAVSGTLAFGGLVGLGVGYAATQRSDHPAGVPLAKIAVIPGIAGLCYAAVVFLRETLLVRALEAVALGCLTFAPAYFVVFALVYTGRGEWLTRWRRSVLVGTFGALSVLVAFDVLLRNAVSVHTRNGLTVPVVERTPEIAVAAFGPAYAAILFGIGLLARFLVSSRNIYRKQTLVIIVAVLTTTAGSLAFEAGLSPHPGLNLTSVFFTVEVSLIAVVLLRYEFLEVEPLAPDVVINEMEDPVIVFDESRTLVDANRAASRLIDSDDPVGDPLEHVLPELQRALEAGAEYVPPPGPTSTDGGTERLYHVKEASIRDQFDRDRGTVVVLREITEQKRREQTFEALQSASRELLAATTQTEVCEIAVRTAEEVLACPYSGTMLYDADEEVLRPGPFTETLTDAFEGKPPAEPTVGPGDSDVWQVFASGEERLGDPIESADNTLPVDLSQSLLFPLGDHGVLGISASHDHEAFSDDDYRFARILARTTENALDRVVNERQLLESRELLAKRKEQVEFFNSVLRHDMLNGIQVIRAHTEELQRLTDGEPVKHVETIDEWTEDISELTHTVRSLTDSITDGGEMDLQPTAIGTAIAEKADKYRQSHDDVTIEIEPDLAELPAVRADEMISEVFENVIGNAVEHVDTDPEIRIDATRRDRTVRIHVADNGPGIDDERKQAVFEDRVSASASGSIGFGLYFVRVMMDLYGGDVWFEDSDSGGAVAVLEFPVADRSDGRKSPSW